MVHQWSPDDWELFANRLVRQRHGPENVQAIPNDVHGDAGLECVTTDGCAYQAYAPEPAPIQKTVTDKIGAKARTDLQKLITHKVKITKILGPKKIRRWILLTPEFRDKENIMTIQAKAKKIKSSGLPFISEDFDALIHDLDDFSIEYNSLRLKSLGAPLTKKSPSEDDLKLLESEIGSKLAEKLEGFFPESEIPDQIRQHAHNHLISQNALHDLRIEYPDYWDRVDSTLDAARDELATLGASGPTAIEQLKYAVNSLKGALEGDLDNFHGSIRTHIALGTASTWLIECPLKFKRIQ